MKSPCYILGISAFYHDSAAVLLKDGQVICAIQEERLSRQKHDARFPEQAIKFCLETAHIDIGDLHCIAYYEKPLLKFERILDTYVANAPWAIRPFIKAIKSWTREKLWVPSQIKKATGFKGPIYFSEHHLSHAASACYTSPFKQSAFLTIDGVGEWATASYGMYKDKQLKVLCEQHFPHSVGLLYSAFTQYCGFKVNSGEYKLMGLAPYGTPSFSDLIKTHLVDIHADGSIELDMSYFSFHRGLKMINQKFCDLFGRPAKIVESDLDQFYADVAASIQAVVEEIILKMAEHVKSETDAEHLCLSGGVALNCTANGTLKKSGLFKDYWIQPACGDAGGALGAALLTWHQLKTEDTTTLSNFSPYLGQSFDDKEIEHALNGLRFNKHNNDDLFKLVAQHLNSKAVVGWFQGRDEWGPRALGNRSILASPCFEDMQSHLNMAIKKRESFRPFAPVVLEECAEDWFEITSPSSWMLYTHQCRKKHLIPACVHVDGSARIQTVNKNENFQLYKLISAFNKLSSVPVLINTSFNVRGEPIVGSPADAVQCFFNTDMDLLVIGNYLVYKQDNLDRTQQYKPMQYVLD